jgi:hypothetical protein
MHSRKIKINFKDILLQKHLIINDRDSSYNKTLNTSIEKNDSITVCNKITALITSTISHLLLDEYKHWNGHLIGNIFYTNLNETRMSVTIHKNTSQNHYNIIQTNNYHFNYSQIKSCNGIYNDLCNTNNQFDNTTSKLSNSYVDGTLSGYLISQYLLKFIKWVFPTLYYIIYNEEFVSVIVSSIPFNDIYYHPNILSCDTCTNSIDNTTTTSHQDNVPISVVISPCQGYHNLTSTSPTSDISNIDMEMFHYYITINIHSKIASIYEYENFVNKFLHDIVTMQKDSLDIK